MLTVEKGITSLFFRLMSVHLSVFTWPLSSFFPIKKAACLFWLHLRWLMWGAALTLLELKDYVNQCSLNRYRNAKRPGKSYEWVRVLFPMISLTMYLGLFHSQRNSQLALHGWPLKASLLLPQHIPLLQGQKMSPRACLSTVQQPIYLHKNFLLKPRKLQFGAGANCFHNSKENDGLGRKRCIEFGV